MAMDDATEPATTEADTSLLDIILSLKASGRHDLLEYIPAMAADREKYRSF